jgi:peptidoglycan/xylan/chitin deacetylase (PgdA/CDA1 family)
MERKGFGEFVTADLGTRAAQHLQRFFPDMLWRVPTSERIAYLTFDDGPTDRTLEYLELLDDHNACATFFVLGSQARKYPDMIRELAESPHGLGHHSMTHPDAWMVPRNALWRDLYRGKATIEDLTGQQVTCVRPPYGHFNRAMRVWCARTGDTLVMWDVVAGDYLPRASSDRIGRRVVRHTRTGSIIVLHDNPRFNGVTLPAVRSAIETLSGRGWSFSALPLRR